MEKKRIIPEGTKWSMLTYIEDVECDNKSKRPLRVICECGKVKIVEMSALDSGNTRTCGKTQCKNKLYNIIERSLDKQKEDLNNKQSIKDKELNELTKYWRKIERTGNIHNIANGMLMTSNFLANTKWRQAK
jgi:hypothetical protein